MNKGVAIVFNTLSRQSLPLQRQIILWNSHTKNAFSTEACSHTSSIFSTRVRISLHETYELVWCIPEFSNSSGQNGDHTHFRGTTASGNHPRPKARRNNLTPRILYRIQDTKYHNALGVRLGEFGFSPGATRGRA